MVYADASMKILLSAVILFCLTITLSAESPNKTLTAHRITSVIAIHGRLSEASWSLAEPRSDFLQYDPDEGSQPSECSAVLLLYDDHALYVGAILYDADSDLVKGQLSRRDRYTHADRFEVLIDSNRDLQTAYHFAVNVSNVQQDGIYSHDGARYDLSWDAVWESATVRLERGWSIEMRIPFTILRFDRAEGEHRWGVNFRRFIARKNEEIHWIMVPRTENGMVSWFGEIHGIRNIAVPLYFEILPYAVSHGRRRSASLPQVSEKDVLLDVGIDMKLGLASNTTLDVAINPDFGQVEIDQAIINLTAFETFYPEKRPFFLEGADLFRFGSTYDGRDLRLFYSRRIGRRPPRPVLNPGEQFIELPQITRLLGAAKLTSRTQSGLSVGALAAVTDREDALINTPTGDRREELIQPRGGFNALRLKQEISGNSALGIMFTNVSQDGSRPAHSGGIDWNLRLFNNSYVLDGFIAGARNDVQGTTRDGSAGRLYIARPSGKNWLGSLNYEFYSPGFDINDGGYNRRADYRVGWADIYFKNDFAAAPIRRYRIRLAGEAQWNFAGYNIKKDSQFSVYSLFTNFYSSSLSYQYNWSSYDDLETRGRGLYKRPQFHTVDGWLSTDLRRRIIAYPIFSFHWNDRGWTEYYLKLDFDMHPTSYIELSPAVGLFRSKKYEAWITNTIDEDLGPISLFGDRDVDQLEFSLRGIFTLQTNLSIQFFTQVLLSRVWYASHRRLVSPDTFVPYAGFDPANLNFFNPDFNYQSFNANIVLRWEYTRGSTIYLVWTQERNDLHSRVHQPFQDTLRDTFRTPMDNVILIKFTYWFSV